MNKRFILALIATVSLCLTFSHFTNASTSSLKQLEDIAALVKDEQLPVEKWEVIAKENFTAQELYEKKQQIQEEYPDFNFKSEETDEIIKYTANNHHKRQKSVESIIMIVPKNKEHSAELIVKLSGSTWDKDIAEFYSSKLVKLEDFLFTDKMTKFSCVTATLNGNMNSLYFFEKITEKLNVQTLTSTKENDFVTLSGYTEHWEQAIPAGDNPMNLQLAARTGLGGETTITIGTPIITTEY